MGDIFVKVEETSQLSLVAEDGGFRWRVGGSAGLPVS